MALCKRLRTGIICDEVTVGGLPGVFLEDAIEVADVLETGLVARIGDVRRYPQTLLRILDSPAIHVVDERMSRPLSEQVSEAATLYAAQPRQILQLHGAGEVVIQIVQDGLEVCAAIGNSMSGFGVCGAIRRPSPSGTTA